MKKEHKPAMMVIAEACLSKREIRVFIRREAERLLGAPDYPWRVRDRKWLIQKLNEFCDNHYWGDYQRKKTVEQEVARALRRRGFYKVPALPSP
jgi:hypothetical protein